MVRRSGSYVWKATVAFILVTSLLLTLFPMFWMLSTSFKSHTDVFKKPPELWPAHPVLTSYQNLNSEITPIKRFFLNSVVNSAGTVGIALLFSVFAGYALSRLKFRFRRTILLGILVTQMFPLVVLLVPLYLLYIRLRLINTYAGIILAFTSFTLPFCIWMIKGFVDKVPVEVEEAAIVDGCSRFRILFAIVCPLISPGIVAAGIFAFLDAWNNLLFPLTLVNDIAMKTLPPGMILAFGGEFKHDWSGMMATSTLVSIPVVIIFILVQRYMVEGLAGGAVKG